MSKRKRRCNNYNSGQGDSTQEGLLRFRMFLLLDIQRGPVVSKQEESMISYRILDGIIS